MRQHLGQITWLNGQLTDAPPCPACEADGAKTLVLETANAIQRRDPVALRLVVCEACRTRYWTDLSSFHYEEPAPHPWATRFYVEQGASIDGLIEPIARLPAAGIKSCLEIGCGFGFSLDAGRVLFGWRTVGVDPSPLASAGRAALGIDIRPIYADADTELGGPFDLVYGSEVIEHVAAPQDLLRICRAHLAPGGMLVLTTPDGDSIRPDVPTSGLMPILSPGHHLVLFNRDSLQSIARAAGFAFTQIVLREYGLVLYASDRPFVVDGAPMVDRGPYRAYLTGILEKPGRTAELRTGLRYRLFKELVNAGEYDDAITLFDEIIADCRARFGLELSPAKALDIIAAVRRGRFNAPFSLPGLLFFRGMAALNRSSTPADSAPWFEAAAATATAFRAAYQAVGIDDGETGEIERQGPELAVLALCHSDPALAVERLRLLPNPGDEFIETLALRLLDLGHPAQAGEAAALTDNAALKAMVVGWGHLLNNRHAEAHEALLGATADEGMIGRRARSADVLVLGSLDPAESIRQLRQLPNPDESFLQDIALRLLDLGHFAAAAEATALSSDRALQAMVAGWTHLVQSRHAEAHEELTLAAEGGGEIRRRARRADMLVLASLDPDAAVKLGRELSVQSVPLDELFARLVDLGHLSQAAALESAVSGSESWRVLGRRGILALIYTKDPPFAAELLQRAFDAAGAQASADELWRLKYHQLLALISAAKAGAAKEVAKEIAAAGDSVPRDIREMVESLLNDHPAVRPG